MSLLRKKPAAAVAGQAARKAARLQAEPMTQTARGPDPGQLRRSALVAKHLVSLHRCWAQQRDQLILVRLVCGARRHVPQPRPETVERASEASRGDINSIKPKRQRGQTARRGRRQPQCGKTAARTQGPNHALSNREHFPPELNIDDDWFVEAWAGSWRRGPVRGGVGRQNVHAGTMSISVMSKSRLSKYEGN